MKEKIFNRYNIFEALLVFVTLLMILTLVNLQIVNGEQYDLQSQKRVLSESKIPAPRGNILDRNGVPIAVNRESYAVQIYKPGLKGDELNAMLLKLADILEKNGDSYNEKLSAYLTINPIDFGSEIKGDEAKIKKWKQDMVGKGKSIDFLTDAQSVFNWFREEKFGINSEYTDEQAYKIMAIRYDILMDGYYTVNTIASDVSRESVAEIEERHDEFPGVTITTVPYRKYIDGDLVAHVLGYVGPIYTEEYEELKKQGYTLNDTIGKTGIEAAAEKYLRGTNGIKRVERDINGRVTRELEGKPVEPGSDVYLTIDMNLQKVAMESLIKNIEYIKTKEERENYHDAFAGAVVVIDVNSGEVLAMVSYPSYNPTAFLESKSNKEMKNLVNQWQTDSVNLPLYNRAIAGVYAHGSTFKPIVGLAALAEGVISTQNSYRFDPGYLNVEGQHFTCLEYPGYGHGTLDLRNALATSCNIYFYNIAMELGLDSLNKWVKKFGLGEKTGIDIAGEVQGMRASRENYDGVWGLANTARVGIGQFNQYYTPLQIANYIATIANGGKRYTPHLIKQAVRYDGTIVEGSTYSKGYEQIDIAPEIINAVKEGMEAVANSAEGTASYAFTDIPIKVAGKTGTAETGRKNESSNALFVAYAPAENPQIAITIVIEKGAWGTNCAPIAADIVKEYFGLNDPPVSDTATADEAVFVK